uniref:Protein transport protein Sec16A n=1 Tax=Strongyloides venezuelensis TaxID=75913 RepID=A0A0K0EVK0_STRVS
MWNSGSNSDQPNTGNGFNTGNFSNLNQKSSPWNQGVTGSQNESLPLQPNGKYNGSGWMKQNMEQGQQMSSDFQNTQSGGSNIRNGSLTSQNNWNMALNNNWSKNPSVGSYADHVKKNMASGYPNTAYSHRVSQMQRLDVNSPLYDPTQSWNAGKVNQEVPWDGVHVNDGTSNTWNQNTGVGEYGKVSPAKNQQPMIGHWNKNTSSNNKVNPEPSPDMIWQNPDSEECKKQSPDNGTNFWGKPDDHLHIKRWVIGSGDPFFDQAEIDSYCTEDWSKIDFKGTKDGVIGSHLYTIFSEEENKKKSEKNNNNNEVNSRDWSEENNEFQNEKNDSKNHSNIPPVFGKKDIDTLNCEVPLEAQFNELNTGNDVNLKSGNTGQGQTGGLQIETKDSNPRVSQTIPNNQSPNDINNDIPNNSPSSFTKSRLYQWKNGNAARGDFDSIVSPRCGNGLSGDNNNKQILNQQLFEFLPSEASQTPFDLNNTFPNSVNNFTGFGNFMNNIEMGNAFANQFAGPSGIPCVPNISSNQMHSQRISREVPQNNLLQARNDSQIKENQHSEVMQRIHIATVYAQVNKIRDPHQIFSMIFMNRENATIWNMLVGRLYMSMEFYHIFNSNCQMNLWPIFQRSHVCPLWIAIQHIEVPDIQIRSVIKNWGEILYFPVKLPYFTVFKINSPLVHSIRSFRNDMINRYPTTSLSLLNDDSMKVMVEMLSQKRTPFISDPQSASIQIPIQIPQQIQQSLLPSTYSDFMSVMNPINTGNPLQTINDGVNFSNMPWSTSDCSQEGSNQCYTTSPSTSFNRNPIWGQNMHQWQGNDSNITLLNSDNAPNTSSWNINMGGYGSIHNEGSQSSFNNTFCSGNSNHPF